MNMPQTQPRSGGGSPGDTDENRRTIRSRLHTVMYQAAFEGDWQAAEIVLLKHPNVVHERITESGDTALHVAAGAKQTKFVRKLVKRMDPVDVLLENKFGYTAFIYAAASGIVKIAAVMREKNGSLIASSCKENRTPIFVAALFGHTDMVSYLFEFTRHEDLKTEQWFELLLTTIEKHMYDVALKILINDKSLATKMNSKGQSALRLLAQHEISNISSCQQAILERLDRTFAAIPYLSWLKRICEQPLMRKRAWLLAHELWDEIQRVKKADLFDQLINDPPILHDAAKLGNVGFITMLTRSDPDLIFKLDGNGHTIFHIAVLHRQEKVFRLFPQIGAKKDWIAMDRVNRGCNNILHLAGKSAPESRLKIVAGPALQMQRELMWFKEVEKIVPSLCRNAKNKKGELPRALFSQSHKELLTDGEKWMKDTANYCMVTATLIATMVFAASITVPGGNNGEKGSPILLNRSLFTVFVVSDVAAMFFSTFSIIMFLSILTSRFQEDDFLVSLPGKLIFGLTALFFSIVSTIAAFTSTCFLLFTDQSAWIAISVAAVACLFLTFIFVLLHFRLWIDTIRSTYYSSFLFGPSKHSLFWKSRFKCGFLLRFVGCTCRKEENLGLEYIIRISS